jgi:hypothetical protein
MMTAETHNDLLSSKLRGASADRMLANGEFQSLAGDAVLRLVQVVRAVDNRDGSARHALSSLANLANSVYECKTLTANTVVANGTMYAVQFSGPAAQVGDVVLAAQLVRSAMFVVIGVIAQVSDVSRTIGPVYGGQNAMVSQGAGVVVSDEITAVDKQQLQEIGTSLAMSVVDMFAGKQDVGDVAQTAKSYIRVMHGGLVDQMIGLTSTGVINEWMQPDELTEATDDGAVIIASNDSVRIIGYKVDRKANGGGGSTIIAFIDRANGEVVSKVSVTGDGRVSLAGNAAIDMQHIAEQTAAVVVADDNGVTIGGKYSDAETLIDGVPIDRTKQIALLAEQVRVHCSQLDVVNNDAKVILSHVGGNGSFTRAEPVVEWVKTTTSMLNSWATTLQAMVVAFQALGVTIPPPSQPVAPALTKSVVANENVKA